MNITENIKIFLQLYMIKTDLLTCHRDLVMGGCYYTFLDKLYSNMKIIPHYKVIGPYKYDRIIHNIENNYSKKQDGKMHLV